MLLAVLMQLFGHLSPISKTIQVRREGQLRSKDELISDVLLLRDSFNRPARTYIHQLCVDTRYSLEDLSRIMNDGDGWQRRTRKICATIKT